MHIIKYSDISLLASSSQAILTYSQRHRLTTVVSVKSMVNMLDNTIETWKMLCRFRLTVTDLDQMFQSLLMMFLGGKTTIICKSD